jgi:menaquinone-9 beta-reductase
MDEVIVVGAGPAGAVAAIVLARAGVRVRLIDRAKFPRSKLCGDTVNPGALADLRRLQLSADVESHGRPIHGMVVCGEMGARVAAPYANGITGRSIERIYLDGSLLRAAIQAGAVFEEGARVVAPLVDTVAGTARPRVKGVRVGHGGRRHSDLRAGMTIAADGGRSTLARALRLAGHPRWPRRWAIGAYFEDVVFDDPFGEMHVTRNQYLGVAPLPNGRTNVCLVVPASSAARAVTEPAIAIEKAIAANVWLRERFGNARMVTRPAVLGPLAVDASGSGVEGMLLAGDAGGFVDPITGDGLRFAVRGGELAGETAIEWLAGRLAHAHESLHRRRHREFGRKWRFNRALRLLVGSPAAVRAASMAGTVVPAAVRQIVRMAGDVRRRSGEA